MPLGKELLNKPIITIDEGRLLGRVQDVYLDEALQSVAGLYLGSQGLIKRRAQLIDREDIVVFGVDAILARTADVITDDHEHPLSKRWTRREEVTGREIDTPGGTKLGIVGDVLVDEDGTVLGFALSRTFVEGPLAARRAIDRVFILDTGEEDGRMTADLAALEHSLMPEEKQALGAAQEQTAGSAQAIEVTVADTEETAGESAGDSEPGDQAR